MKKIKYGQIIVYAISAIGGYLIASYIIEHSYSFWQLLYAFLWFLVDYYIGIIIHESGHLIMGLKSGYEFVSFRIGSMTWIKEDGKLKKKKFNIAGTGGQCIMIPPDSAKPEDIPFFLFLLGGGLFNFITAAIFIPLGILIPNFYFSMPLFMLGAASVIQGIVNLIPLNLQVPNDGYNIVNLSRKKTERVFLYRQLRLNGLLYKGFIPSEIPKEMFDYGEESHGLGELLKASFYMDKKDFNTAQKLVTSAIDSGDLLSIYEHEAKSELLFCKIMNGASENEINELYNKTLKKYITSSAKTQISKRRILYAYNILFKKDNAAAQKEYEAAMAMKNTYPSAGELKSELSIIEYIKNVSSNLSD